MGQIRHSAVIFLTAVFYGVISSSVQNRTEPPDLDIYPEGPELNIPSRMPFVLTCYRRNDIDFRRMVWIDPKGNVIPDGFRISHMTDLSRRSSTLTLRILSPQRAHSGTYTCLAEYNTTIDTSDPGSVDKIEVSVNITVRDKPQITKFENVTRSVGNRAVLECNAKSQPTPNITISKANGTTFAEDEDNRIEVTYLPEYDRNSVRVTFKLVKRSDEGFYFCTAEANGYSSSRNAYLEVQFPPNISSTPLKQLLDRPQNFTTLTCIAEANPPAEISWEYQNKEIDPKHQRNFASGHEVTSYLMISTNNTSNYSSIVSGMFKCTARNLWGSQSINITLQEDDVPGEISQIIFDIVTPRSITFRFLGPSNNGGKPIIAYVVNYSTPADYNYSVTEWPVGSLYMLKNLKPGAHYVFSMAAKNAIGVGAWKTSNYIMPRDKDINDTTVDPHTLITKNVNITDYPDRYEIRWKANDDNGRLKRYFIVTYFNDGRIKVEHQNGNTTFPL